MKSTIIVVMLIISMNSFAQDEYPIIPKTGPSMESFIPKGWKVIMQRAGDLNKDGLADEAMVIQNTDLKNIIANEEGRMGGDTLDINPRMLIVLFKTSGGSYALAAKNVAFIPEQNDNERPCLLDPLLESDGITINKGLLKIQYKDFYSCGAWEVYVADYTFRYQNQKFELIGYDDYSMHRASGEEFSSSTNFSTFKQKSISGGNVFSEEKNKPKKVWKRIKPVKLLDLERLTEDVLNAFLVEIWK